MDSCLNSKSAVILSGAVVFSGAKDLLFAADLSEISRLVNSPRRAK